MTNPEFNKIQAQIQSCYAAADYAGALQLAERYASDFPEHTHLFTYWRVCMAARLDQPQVALNLLEQVLSNGFWYGETLLRRSPSLQGLQGRPDFEALVQRNQQQRLATQAQEYPLLAVRPRQACDQPSKPCPLLIGLHSNAALAQTSLPFWQAPAQSGWLVAAPQSSQAMWRGAYIWDDLEIARQEVHHRYLSLLERYSINRRQIVLAGHSMGAEVALWLALNHSLPVLGVLMVGPGGPFTDEPGAWQEFIQAYWQEYKDDNLPLRAAIVLGELDDSIPHRQIGELAEQLNESGIEVRLEVVPGAAHDYQAEYNPAVLRALKHITGG